MTQYTISKVVNCLVALDLLNIRILEEIKRMPLKKLNIQNIIIKCQYFKSLFGVLEKMKATRQPKYCLK